MINFRNTVFIKSTPTIKEKPALRLKEFLFVGKSNVGKSSLLNALCDNRQLAFTSSKPGHTRLLNYFSVEERFYIVDAPGYGYAKTGRSHTKLFGAMMEEYFSENNELSGVFFLVDSRHPPTKDDIGFFQFIKESGVPFAIVLTKADKLNQSEKSKIKANILTAFGALEQPLILTTIEKKSSLDSLKGQIEKWL